MGWHMRATTPGINQFLEYEKKPTYQNDNSNYFWGRNLDRVGQKKL